MAQQVWLVFAEDLGHEYELWWLRDHPIEWREGDRIVTHETGEHLTFRVLKADRRETMLGNGSLISWTLLVEML